MHASIALFVMMTGGWMAPEPEVTTIPLKSDIFNVTSIQDLEWKESTKRVRLPRVPTIQDDYQQASDSRTRGRYPSPYPPTDPQAPHPPTPNLPSPPTSAGPATGTGYQPGMVGQAGNYGQAGGYSSGGYTSGIARNDPYGNANLSTTVRGAPGVAAPSAPSAPQMPSVNNYVANNSMRGGGMFGNIPANPITAGGPPKAFNDYRPPSGGSPWNYLYTSNTNNGTVSPYMNYVQPALQQQNFNAHISEQIQGVQTMQRMYNSMTPGVENPRGQRYGEPQHHD